MQMVVSQCTEIKIWKNRDTYPKDFFCIFYSLGFYALNLRGTWRRVKTLSLLLRTQPQGTEKCVQKDFEFTTVQRNMKHKIMECTFFPPLLGGGEHPGKLLNSYHSQFVHRKFIICIMREKNCKGNKQYTKSLYHYECSNKGITNLKI